MCLFLNASQCVWLIVKNPYVFFPETVALATEISHLPLLNTLAFCLHDFLPQKMRVLSLLFTLCKKFSPRATPGMGMSHVCWEADIIIEIISNGGVTLYLMIAFLLLCNVSSLELRCVPLIGLIGTNRFQKFPRRKKSETETMLLNCLTSILTSVLIKLIQEKHSWPPTR